jgi:hypothetical protein
MKVAREKDEITLKLTQKEFNHLSGALRTIQKIDFDSFHNNGIHRCWTCSQMITELGEKGEKFLTNEW